MNDVIIVGDGPGGLSAALFLAKNDMNVTVYGQDKTAMHWALLYNYLGIPKITGTDFQKIARQQVLDFGATLVDDLVTDIDQTEDGFTIQTEGGQTAQAKYVVLAEGKELKLGKSMGLEADRMGFDVDRNGRTAVSNLYAVGRATKLKRSQAIISAGEGAAAALDILSTEAGKDILDYDSPPKDE